MGWPGGWDLPTSAGNPLPLFFFRWRENGGAVSLPLLAGGEGDTHVLPDRSQQGERRAPNPSPTPGTWNDQPWTPLSFPVYSSWQSFLSQLVLTFAPLKFDLIFSGKQNVLLNHPFHPEVVGTENLGPKGGWGWAG